MLKVKQIRKDNSGSTTYLTPITFKPTTIKTRGYESDIETTVFTDFALNVETKLSTNQSYYLRFNAKRPLPTGGDKPYGDPDEISFNIVLYEQDGGTEGLHDNEKTQTIEKNLKLSPWVDKYNNEWQEFTVVFTPNENYQYIALKINRIGYDYVYEGTPQRRNPFIYNESDTSHNTLNFTDQGDFALINNILSVPSSSGAALKIGIQARPGTLFCVNREPIYLGRSGIYEINNGTKISFVGIAAPNGNETDNVPDFILDYAYDE